MRFLTALPSLSVQCLCRLRELTVTVHHYFWNKCIDYFQKPKMTIVKPKSESFDI